jgi:hypothetical protein
VSTAEYQVAVKAVVLCARLLSVHDIPEIIAAIEHSDAFGCFIDPTLWSANRDKMLDKEVLQAGLPLWKLAKKLQRLAEPVPADVQQTP